MALPVVAIVGRPNVGKSSLLNRLAGQLISIVEPTAGVTRDRVTAIVEHDGVWFELMDTGGYGVEDTEDLTDHIARQIDLALQSADLILFVVDVREGRMPLDVRVAELLRHVERPVWLVVNKVDVDKLAPQAAEFYSLGLDEPMLVSARHGRGHRELLDIIARHFAARADPSAPTPAEPVMKLAVVGRRNVGKSTFINVLAGQERMIVSEVPGTTRDAVDVRFEKDGRTFVAIDTAGVRKRRKIADDIEYYSFARVTRSIRRADVVLLLLDATATVGQVDKRLAGFLAESFKPCILVVNKWDLAKGRADTSAYGKYLSKTLPHLDYAPVAFVTAKDGRNVQSTIDLAISLYKQACSRVSTAQLNAALQQALGARAPAAKRGRGLPRIYYATQAAVRPPTIVLFVNQAHLVGAGYRRFLLNRFREFLPFAEIPIRLLFRSSGRAPARAAGSEQGKREPAS
jgi:GTP-binding protein